VKADMLEVISKSLGNHVVSSEEEKERLQWEGFAEKGWKDMQLMWCVILLNRSSSWSVLACSSTQNVQL